MWTDKIKLTDVKASVKRDDKERSTNKIKFKAVVSIYIDTSKKKKKKKKKKKRERERERERERVNKYLLFLSIYPCKKEL